MLMLSMRKFGPTKEEEEIWPFSSNATMLQNKLLHCQPPPPGSIGGSFSAKLLSFVPQYLAPPY